MSNRTEIIILASASSVCGQTVMWLISSWLLLCLHIFMLMTEDVEERGTILYRWCLMFFSMMCHSIMYVIYTVICNCIPWHILWFPYILTVYEKHIRERCTPSLYSEMFLNYYNFLQLRFAENKCSLLISEDCLCQCSSSLIIPSCFTLPDVYASCEA